MSTHTYKFIETDSKFLEQVAIVVSDENGEWFYMPFWYKKIGEGLFVQYNFEDLTPGLKEYLKDHKTFTIIENKK